MPVNKQALIRYHALDRCFSNPGRRFFMADLIEACNQALQEAIGDQVSVSRRQIFDDIRFMESQEGWSIPLEKSREGRKTYYRYADPTFSIRNLPLNEAERAQLEETLHMLQRFQGLAQSDWLEELKVRLVTQGTEAREAAPIVQFEQNPYLSGMEHFWPLFQAIRNQQVLGVSYRSFRHANPEEVLFHPYLLKEYNSRWFVFGWNGKRDDITILALDRIQAWKPVNMAFVPNTELELEGYFEDMIGVSKKRDQQAEIIHLKIASQTWPYIQTKPLHGSQKVLKRDQEEVWVELEVVVNYELISTLLSFGGALSVIVPEHLRATLKEHAKKILENNS